MDYAIRVEHLAKYYGDVHALEDVVLDVHPGKITGLLGPNGAGKSTLIKSLVGALQPNQGSIQVLGLDPIHHRWQLRPNLGYMPQEPALYDDLSALENVAFYARLHRDKQPQELAEKLLTELDLGQRLRSPIFTLSGGMQKRVSLAAALVHNPKLLILDEPTAALDPLLKRSLWQRFRQLADEGKTLIISTHLMDEAMLCDRVVLMQHGNVVAHDTPRNLIETGSLTLRYHQNGQDETETMPADGVALAKALQRHGLSPSIDQVKVEEENLEDVMVRMLGREDQP